MPVAATLEASSLKLDAEVANVHARRWLDEVANARVHATSKAVPALHLAEERAVMLPAPALKAPPVIAQRVALPVESLQHPLSVYDELLEVACAGAFGLKVISHDPFCKPEAFRALGVTSASFDELLSCSDAISLHVPLIEANLHMIDARAIARMKKGALLPNTARGGLVDTAAVIDAVRCEHLSGAGLDVLEQEPPAPELLAHGLDNLLVTPHLVFYSEEAIQNLQQQAAVAVAVVLQGKDAVHWLHHW